MQRPSSGGRYQGGNVNRTAVIDSQITIATMRPDDVLPTITASMLRSGGSLTGLSICLDGLSCLTFFGTPAQIDQARKELLESLWAIPALTQENTAGHD